MTEHDTGLIGKLRNRLQRTQSTLGINPEQRLARLQEKTALAERRAAVEAQMMEQRLASGRKRVELEELRTRFAKARAARPGIFRPAVAPRPAPTLLRQHKKRRRRRGRQGRIPSAAPLAPPVQQPRPMFDFGRF